VPVLFQHSLHECEDQIVNNLDHIFSVQPLKIKSPSTDAEVSLALRVLEGCCLLHKESTLFAHQFKAIQALNRFSEARPPGIYRNKILLMIYAIFSVNNCLKPLFVHKRQNGRGHMIGTMM
ncbi:armadillo-type fold protein, partial [Tanacetum coccineum]